MKGLTNACQYIWSKKYILLKKNSKIRQLRFSNFNLLSMLRHCWKRIITKASLSSPMMSQYLHGQLFLSLTDSQMYLYHKFRSDQTLVAFEPPFRNQTKKMWNSANGHKNSASEFIPAHQTKLKCNIDDIK